VAAVSRVGKRHRSRTNGKGGGGRTLHNIIRDKVICEKTGSHSR